MLLSRLKIDNMVLAGSWLPNALYPYESLCHETVVLAHGLSSSQLQSQTYNFIYIHTPTPQPSLASSADMVCPLIPLDLLQQFLTHMVKMMTCLPSPGYQQDDTEHNNDNMNDMTAGVNYQDSAFE